MIVQSPMSKEGNIGLPGEIRHLDNEIRKKFIPNYSKIKIKFGLNSKNKRRSKTLPSKHKSLR